MTFEYSHTDPKYQKIINDYYAEVDRFEEKLINLGACPLDSKINVLDSWKNSSKIEKRSSLLSIYLTDLKTTPRRSKWWWLAWIDFHDIWDALNQDRPIVVDSCLADINACDKYQPNISILLRHLESTQFYKDIVVYNSPYGHGELVGQFWIRTPVIFSSIPNILISPNSLTGCTFRADHYVYPAKSVPPDLNDLPNSWLLEKLQKEYCPGEIHLSSKHKLYRLILELLGLIIKNFLSNHVWIITQSDDRVSDKVRKIGLQVMFTQEVVITKYEDPFDNRVIGRNLETFKSKNLKEVLNQIRLILGEWQVKSISYSIDSGGDILHYGGTWYSHGFECFQIPLPPFFPLSKIPIDAIIPIEMACYQYDLYKGIFTGKMWKASYITSTNNYILKILIKRVKVLPLPLLQIIWKYSITSL